MMLVAGAPMIFSAVLTIHWRDLRISAVAVPVPDSDAAAEDALNIPPVESGENGRRKAGLFQPPQEVETLLGFFGDGGGVDCPGEVIYHATYYNSLQTGYNIQFC